MNVPKKKGLQMSYSQDFCKSFFLYAEVYFTIPFELRIKLMILCISSLIGT